MNYRVLVAATFAAVAVHAADIDPKLPQPWFKNGAKPAAEQCLAGVDTQLEAQGTPNMTLRCDATVDGFAGVMQMFAADDYRGKRVRFSALVKAEGIEGWAGLWMRVDEGRESVAFDNMQNRPIKGTQDWTRYSVVLDVSQDASGIFFGTLTNGKGQLWISKLSFEEVGTDVPVTGTGPSRKLDSKPGNLELSR
ncbi:MAG TPA: hypothetical protein VFV75_03870 [Candidatus Polarisedimenticolaceae bacterium]|nr:hypothetical protein [Candidatus Polarisedimenticolaceae bacterium]